jgi:predicted Rossmann fold flavoprotein
MKTVAIIGGGASGFFTAINLAEKCTKADITIYEASKNLLGKVLISGGGRCNVTNQISEAGDLSKNYPRGEEFLKDAFEHFSSNDTREWFQKRGVETKVESDGRVFPVSDSSLSIYKLFMAECERLGIRIETRHRLTEIKKDNNGYHLSFANGNIQADYCVLCTSISSGIERMVNRFGIETIRMVPSLFTFNAKNHQQKHLSGVGVSEAAVSIQGIEHSTTNGPMLITHWGYSGPAILKLSAWFARELHALDYSFNLLIDWMPEQSHAETLAMFKEFSLSKPKDKVLSWKDHSLPKRLWQDLFKATALREFANWSEIGKKKMLILSDLLHKFSVPVDGKSTFKEEFVTAGGIDLDQLDNRTFGLKNYPGLYAIGEILNIDAITGGFNFQAAWTGAYLASQNIANEINKS